MRAKVLLHSFDEKFKAFAYFNVVDLGEGFNPGFISEKRKRIRIRHNKITKAELRDVKSFTRSKSFKPNFTPRNARKLRHI